jgi:hypothetical protein
MRKQSFLSLSVILMLFLSACTKEDNLQYNPGNNPVEDNSQAPYSFSYSNWTADTNLTWSDGATTEPTRQSQLAVPELTQDVIDAGGFVLVYAQSNADGTIQAATPAAFFDLSTNERNTYSANYQAGFVSLSHTRFVDGIAEVPNDSNEISFRYFVITPNTPDPNGRPMTMDDLRYMPYQGLVSLLGIPE